MKRWSLVLLAILAWPAMAQPIKALPEADAKQYLAGAGMGYAKAAELNHYPGPMHALELAEELKLSTEQRAAARQLMDEHKAQARAIGAKFVEAERALDALFAGAQADRDALAKVVREAAAIQGEYRLSHLETHRRMRMLLSAEQVKRYDELRGYAGASQAPAQHQHRKH
jgi:Spy/CpxP family protein refolding chaperone